MSELRIRGYSSIVAIGFTQPRKDSRYSLAHTLPAARLRFGVVATAVGPLASAQKHVSAATGLDGGPSLRVLAQKVL
jgi:hypothetical protein